MCQALNDEYEDWAGRSLAGTELDYLFLDGSHFKYHPGARAEPLLAAWGITTAGRPAFVGLEAAANEGNDAWDGFLEGLKARGLGSPLLVISDGSAGLIGAIERAFPQALRQRCLIYRVRNILAKVPKHAQAELKKAYWALFDIPGDVEPGPGAVELVQGRIDAFADKYQKLFPAAASCLLDDRYALTSYLRFPKEHWQRVRHSNFIVIWSREDGVYDVGDGRLPGEASCTKLIWAVLDRVSRSWRGFTLSSGGLRLLQDLRRQLLLPSTPLRKPPKTDEVTDMVTAVASASPPRELPYARAIYTGPGTPPVLRGHEDPADRGPQPGVGQIHSLVERARHDSRQVELHVGGEPAPLPASVNLGVYRIIEDALSTTTAAPGDIELTVVFGDHEIDLVVTASRRSRSPGPHRPCANGWRYAKARSGWSRVQA